MKATLAIAGTELRRFARDRSNIFFVLIFPMLLVLVLGLQFGGSGSAGSVTLAGAQGDLHRALTHELTDADLQVRTADPDQMRTQVARGRTQVGVVISEEAEQAYADGGTAQVEMIATPGVPATEQRVRTAIDAVAMAQTQQAALVALGADAAEAAAALEQSRASVQGVELQVQDVEEIAQEFAGLGQFDLSAATMLLLFVFLSTLSSAVMLIQSRRLGVQSRVLAAPLTSAQALGGQVLGRWVIAMVQGGYIMLASIWLFDVDFGTTWLALLVIAVFAAVATGAAMLLGAVVDHEGAATGVSVGLGLVLGALGGCMFPLELFPDTLQTVAHITPHAWGYDAFAQIQRHSGELADIGVELAVLAAMAVALVALGSVALRRGAARAM